MPGDFFARLEDSQGRIQGPERAWVPQRQFLWDVVHDTRGLLREESFGDDLAVIRRFDAPQDAGAVRRVYEKLYERAKAHGPNGPHFRLVAPEGQDTWAAVQFFEEDGKQHALVGGWTGLVLRTIAPEADQQFLQDASTVTVGDRRFQVRKVPYAEYFRPDFESLLALLRDAEAKRLRVRFVQR